MGWVGLYCTEIIFLLQKKFPHAELRVRAMYFQGEWIFLKDLEMIHFNKPQSASCINRCCWVLIFHLTFSKNLFPPALKEAGA